MGLEDDGVVSRVGDDADPLLRGAIPERAKYLVRAVARFDPRIVKMAPEGEKAED